MADLFDATLDGYDLEIETLDDQFEKAIARHDIPKMNGAILEDMGLKARVVRIRCYFWDDDGSHFTYADHIDFLNHLKSQEYFELVHPSYGPLQGCVEQVTVRADDRQMTAELDITFVESLAGDLADVEYEWVDVVAGSEEAFLDLQGQLEDSFIADCRTQLGQEAEGILAVVLDPLQPVLGQFEGLSTQARTYVEKVDTFVRGVEAELIEVVNPANGLIAAISYGVNLPGRVIGAVARCLERYVVLYDSLGSAPSRFAQSMRLAALDLESRLGFKSQVRGAAAARAGIAVADLFKADEERRQVLRRSERIASFDRLGRYVKPAPPEPVMTANDLEITLATVRTIIQDALDQDRSLTGLKEMARQLLEHVNSVKLEREKIVAITLDNPLPLHLVCLQRGLPYNYAERIHSINRIANPNEATGQVNVYVR